MADTYEGRLELTWTNKHMRLLAHEDGSYQWVPSSDYRVAEVRLLHDAGTVGEVQSEASRSKDNLLIRGDALSALTSLTSIPEFREEYVGKVKLAYLDPPFNTQQAFEHYDDALEHSVWLTMMRDRLLALRPLLATDSSIWVHCDDSEQAYLKALMDELFGRDRFVATVIWQKRPTRENRAAIGDVHDYIIVFSPRGQKWSEVRNRLPRDAKSLKQYRNPNGDPRGDWRTVPIDAQAGHATAAQFYEIVGPTGKTFVPPTGRAWSLSKERYQQLLDEGRIWFGKDGKGRPMSIRYLDEDQGLVPWTWWTHEEVGHTGESKKELLTLFPGVEPFATPKPERFMHRIIHVATNPGDIVIDAFLGSGTTSAVAHKMGRRWLGIEWSRETLDDFALPRLERVVGGGDAGGITETVGWKGGGGFRILDVAPSMFAEDNGTVVLSGWATNDQLAEATAAQLGFEFAVDQPFCGKKGNARLAVVDGLINEAVVELLVPALAPEERLVVCGTALEPSVRDVLRAASPGSTVRKIPQSILHEYRRQSRWQPSNLNSTGPTEVEETVPA
jgi:adenine-specific DNA-methyltransferase